MNIAVLVKQVPDTASKITLKPDGSGIDESQIKWVVNPYDEFAIEAALEFKDALRGEVIVFSVGPARAADAMRTALAMGCDRAVRIEAAATLDPYSTGRLLAEAIKVEGATFVLGGKQAVDDDAGQVLQVIAESLGWPVVPVIEQLALADDGQGVTVHRPVAGGVSEVIASGFPVILGCDKGLNAPRYPSLPGIMKAKAKPLVEKQAAQLCPDLQPTLVYRSYHLPPERVAGKKITGEPEDVAGQCVEWLCNEAKVI
jgi:electron transfer flavoprotein beta subunit